MTTHIEAFFGLSYLIVGLSHAAHPRLWADFFLALKKTGFAPFVTGLYNLPIGLVFVLGHNLWVWDWRVLVTITGWGLTIKGTLYLLFPRLPNRMIDKADQWEDRFRGFRVVGLPMAVMGGLIAWAALRSL